MSVYALGSPSKEPMNFNRILLKTSALVASVLIFATTSARLGAQVDNSHSDTHLQDLKLIRNLLMNDANEFDYLRKSLHGAEANAALQIANEAKSLHRTRCHILLPRYSWSNAVRPRPYRREGDH